MHAPTARLRRLSFFFLLIALSIIALPAAAEGSPHESRMSTAVVLSSPVLPEPLVPFGTPTQEETRSLQAALDRYTAGSNAEDLSPLRDFLDRNSASPWRQSLLVNLGGIYYRQGYFSKAMEAWRQGWESAKRSTD